LGDFFVMTIKTVLIAPSGSIGQVTANSGSVYPIDANGFVTITNPGDVNPLLNAGFTVAALPLASQALGADGIPTVQIPLLSARASTGAGLGAAAAAGVFGYSITAGTSFGLVSEAANANAKTDVAILEVVVPAGFTAGQNLAVVVNTTIIIGGGTLSVKTIGLNAYRTLPNGTQGADICATAAITIPANTATDNTFTLTGATLQPGDRIVLKLTLALTETAASAVTATINSVRIG
jgi:hypothetical protein